MDVRPISGENGARKVKGAGHPPASAEIRSVRKPADRDSVHLSVSASGNVVLDSIRARIAQGYYNGSDVVDDVADKLARLFDR